MDIEFRNRRLERFYSVKSAARKLPVPVAEAYVDAIDLLRAARDLNALRAVKGLRLERLVEGSRKGQYSIRLNRQWRLILKEGDSSTVVIVWDVNNHYQK